MQETFKGLLVVTGVVLLLGCHRTQPPPSATVFAAIGARRQYLEENLRATGGRVLNSTPDTIFARVFSRDLARPMNVSLTFKEGNLSSVSYSQPAPTRDWVRKTPVGPVGFMTFLDSHVQPPLRDRYLYFGPLGRMYAGSDGLAIHLTTTAEIAGAAAVVGCIVLALRTRWKGPGG